MDEKRDLVELDRELGEWLRAEQKVSAPTRLVEDVFARTTATRQVRKPLLRWRRTDDQPGRGPTALFAIAALLVIGLVGAGTVGSVFRHPAVAVPTASARPSAAAETTLVPLRTFRSCHGYPEMTLVRDADGSATSAWLTCESNSVEVDLASGTVADRPGLGLLAVDGSEHWALRGDSVVKLAADRSVLAAVPIGSPTALGVNGPTVFALDAATGTVSAHGVDGEKWSVVPVPGGQLVSLVVVDGNPWVLLRTPGTLFRLDPDTGDVQTTVGVGRDVFRIIVAAGALYVISPPSSVVTRVDPGTSAKTTFTPDLPALGRLDALGGSADGLLLASTTSVERLDPLTGARLGDVVTGRNFITSLALDGDRMLLGTEDELAIEAQAP
jgi:hypothetical protein